MNLNKFWKVKTRYKAKLIKINNKNSSLKKEVILSFKKTNFWLKKELLKKIYLSRKKELLLKKLDVIVNYKVL